MNTQDTFTVPPLLLAGASGHVGQAILERLQPRSNVVRTLSHNPKNKTHLQTLANESIFADALAPHALNGICEGIEVVISCLGASVSMKSHDKRPYSQLDYQANHNLLQAARQDGVRKFIYVSAWKEASYSHTGYVRGHEAFVKELIASGLDYTIVRPTGIFCTMLEFLDMARQGRVPLLGDGSARTNPVHEKDVASVCVQAIQESHSEIGVGGPDIFSRKQIYELAFAALGRPPRFMNVSPAMMKWGAKVVKFWNPRQSELLEFAAHVSVCDGIAPAVGQRNLVDYFREHIKANTFHFR